MVRYINIATITGIGQNSGKTTFACWLINYLTNKEYVVGAIKISPHLKHADHNQLVFSDNNLFISEENNTSTGKDSAKFRQAGAEKVYFAVCTDNNILKALSLIRDYNSNIDFWVIESGGVNKYIIPGLKVKMLGDSIVERTSNEYKEISFNDLSDINNGVIPEEIELFINHNTNNTDDKF
ncbi:MAG: hypothetical protein N4A72_03580 [Bacteroidales bacterium]|jgi:molybdopterin-guanine dinucleotide biosynthesis protein|nr:hypothetical protein [Bacteroidales bacterium]